MDWTKVARARLVAAVYVVGFLAWLLGVVWILYNQVAGGSAAAMTVGIVLFAIGQAAISTVAFALRKEFPGTTPRQTSFSRAWQHFSLGLEVPAALRLLLNR
jgi:hypothetical protein